MAKSRKDNKRDQQLHLFSDFAIELLPELNQINLQQVFEDIANNNIRADRDPEQWNLILNRILTSNYQYQAFFMKAIKRISKALDEFGLLTPDNRKALEEDARDFEGLPNDEEDYPIPPSPQPGSHKLLLYVEPGDAKAQDIADLYLALASYYRAVGGSGLKITNEGCRTLVEMEAL